MGVITTPAYVKVGGQKTPFTKIFTKDGSRKVSSLYLSAFFNFAYSISVRLVQLLLGWPLFESNHPLGVHKDSGEGEFLKGLVLIFALTCTVHS